MRTRVTTRTMTITDHNQEDLEEIIIQAIMIQIETEVTDLTITDQAD